MKDQKMGSDCYFRIGHLHAGDWRRYVPCEVLLVFTIEDLDYDEGKLCAYKTTASKAKKRLDGYGIDLDFCRRIYEDLAHDPIPSLSPARGDAHVFHPMISFDAYCQGILDVWRNHRFLFELHISERDEDVRDQIIAGSAFAAKDEDDYGFSTEAETLIFMRTLLEMVPARTSLVLDISELVFDYEHDRGWAEQLMNKCWNNLARKVAVDYQLYGFVLTKDPQMRERIGAKIAAMDEDSFIDRILLPLLTKCGFERVQRVKFHGASEFGRDIMPFRQKTTLATYEYFALQAKSTKIHGKSRTSGNVGELISQALAAFSVRFMDDLDNESKRIDKFIIACNQDITPEAREILNSAIEGNRRLLFIDLNKTVDLVCENDLAAYVLFTGATGSH